MADDLPKVHPNDGMSDPREADSTQEAIGIVQQQGETVVVGDEAKEEWLTTDEMRPLSLEDCR